MTRAQWGRAAGWTLVAVCALSAAALAARTWFVAISGGLAATSGFEEFSLYAIWKARHGFTLYEWPQRDNLTLTHYNWAFYHLYGAWAKLWRADGEMIVPCARIFTLLLACGGTAITAHVIRRASPARAPHAAAWAWGLAATAWLGTSYTGWFALTARPDVGGVTAALLGLALYLRGSETRRASWIVAASVAFFAAWSFKQTIVWIFAGALLEVVVARRGWRTLVLLAAPFAVLAAATIGLAGPAYRFSAFGVPLLYHWFPLHGVKLLAQAVAPNLFFWTLAAGALWQGWRARRNEQPDAEHAPVVVALSVIAVPPLAMGFVQICLEASALNNLLEGFALVAILAGATWLRWLATDAPVRAVAAGALLLATLVPLPAVQLTLAARGVPFAAFGPFSLGNLAKLNAEQLARRRAFFEWTRTLPKPLWTRDPMLELPWFSNDNRFPAYLIDREFVSRARGAGQLEVRFVDIVRSGKFASILVTAYDGVASVARGTGYRESEVPGGWNSMPTAFGLEYQMPTLLVRPEPPASGANR